MSSPDVMFEAWSVYFQHVSEHAAHVKIDRVGVDMGHSKSLISLVVRWLLTTGVL